MAKARAAQGANHDGKDVATKSRAAAQHSAFRKKPRALVNIGGLFARHLAKPDTATDSSDPLAQKYAGVAKAKHRSSAAAKQHPLFLNFSSTCNCTCCVSALTRRAGAASAYREGAAQTVTEQLDAVHEDLVARINGVDINGKPLAIPGAPSAADLGKLGREQKALARPLSDDAVTVEHRHKNGNVVEEQVLLGKTMIDFRRKTEMINTKIAPMLKELDELAAEIAVSLRGLLDDKTIVKADKELQAALAALEAEAGKAAKQTLDEVKNARKEDKAASEVANNKFQEFLRSL